jgi:hypothetical protein
MAKGLITEPATGKNTSVHFAANTVVGQTARCSFRILLIMRLIMQATRVEYDYEYVGKIFRSQKSDINSNASPSWQIENSQD